jgi:membrane protein
MSEQREAISDFSQQLGRLVREELRVALRELRQQAWRGRAGAVALGAAGVLALYAGGVLATGFVLLLARRLPPWLAAALAGAMLSALAALAGRFGLEELREVLRVVPEQAAAEVRQDVETVRERER